MWLLEGTHGSAKTNPRERVILEQRHHDVLALNLSGKDALSHLHRNLLSHSGRYVPKLFLPQHGKKVLNLSSQDG